MRTGIFIDDSGNPGITSESIYDTADRKSWLALILNPKDRKEATNQLSQLLANLKEQTGANEFHFTHIFNGKKEFANVPLNKRIQIMETFATIFSVKQYPMIIQTSTGEELGRNNILVSDAKIKCDNFHLDNVSEQALFFLLVRIKGFLKSGMVPLPVDIVIDESDRRKTSTIHKIELLGDNLHHKTLTYNSSHHEPLLQLVDFAAFLLNRVRWIQSHKSKSSLDIKVLEIASNARFNVLNMKRKMVKLDADSVQTYDDMLREVYESHEQLGSITLDDLLKDIYK